MFVLFVFAFLTTFGATFCNYYFVTHESYTASTLNASILASTKVSGELASATQQCRRNCALKPPCQAFQLTLLQNASSLALFNCSLFAQNACNWPQTALITNSSTAIYRVWEKLVETDFKPKPCVEHCGVKYRGNCTACRGYAALQGFDCEKAPRICSEYPANLVVSSRTRRPVWPWGIYGPVYSVPCVGLKTELIFSDLVRGLREISVLGWSASRQAQNLSNFMTFSRLIDWALISRMQRLSEQKILRIHFSAFHATFGGLDISPHGELSLNSSVENPASPGIPLPLVKAPFVEGSSTSCGHFWQFQENISVCSQLTNLFNFGPVKWNGTTNVGYYVMFLFH